MAKNNAKLHFKIGVDSVKFIKNLTGVGPEDLSEIVVSVNNRDMYISNDPAETMSKYGFLYISGYQHPKIINDFYKICFEDSEIVTKILEEYAKS